MIELRSSREYWSQIAISLCVLSDDWATIRRWWYDRRRSHVSHGRSCLGLPWLYVIVEWSLRQTYRDYVFWHVKTPRLDLKVAQSARRAYTIEGRTRLERERARLNFLKRELTAKKVVSGSCDLKMYVPGGRFTKPS